MELLRSVQFQKPMNKIQSFLSFFTLTVLAGSLGIGVASFDYQSNLSAFESRLSDLAFVKEDAPAIFETQTSTNEYQSGQVAGVSTTINEIPAGEEYAMLISIAQAATNPTCTSLLVDSSLGAAPFDARFTGSGVGDSLSYKFVFGDGEQVTTLDAQTTHTYVKLGSYTASLQVISNKLESDVVDACKVNMTITNSPESNPQVAPVVTEISHLVCRNLACVRVAGEGENGCSSNVDCAATAPTAVATTSTVPVESKPLVPVTGNSQLAIYLAIALGFISSGLILLIFI